MRIALVGFMGAGKSTVAELLAKRLQLPFVELDDELLKRTDRSTIPEIFEADGEEAFRALETEALKEVLKAESFVLSPGGGILGADINRTLFVEAGVSVVFLETSFDEIAKRLEGDVDRPLFSDPDKAKELFDSRQPVYRAAASQIIQTDGRSPEEIAKEWRLCCLIGDPVEHSLSPAMHNAAYQAKDLDDQFYYLRVRVASDQLGDRVSWIREANVSGSSVTVPHKEAVMPLLDEIDEIAEKIGSVNTIVNQDGRLKGYNTDYIGLIKTLEEKVTLSSCRVALLGAGGTARAAAFGLNQAGADITIFNRTISKAESLAEQVGCSAAGLDELERLGDFDVIVNTTSIGMGETAGESPVPKELIQPRHVVFDAVYSSEGTQLLKDAESQGATVLLGLRMLLHQGTEQFKLFTGIDVPEDVMWSAILEAIGGAGG